MGGLYQDEQQKDQVAVYAYTCYTHEKHHKFGDFVDVEFRHRILAYLYK